MSTQSTTARFHLPVFEVREIPGFPAYIVGDNGHVWSRWQQRGLAHRLGDKWHILKPAPNTYGYFQVKLSDGHGPKVFKVHALVLMVFVGPCPPGMQCCHSDDNPTNNALSNLRWDTPKANAADRHANGNTAIGLANGSAKLDESKVLQIKRMLASGCSRKSVASLFGVSPSTIQFISIGATWKHVLVEDAS